MSRRDGTEVGSAVVGSDKERRICAKFRMPRVLLRCGSDPQWNLATVVRVVRRQGVPGAVDVLKSIVRFVQRGESVSPGHLLHPFHRSLPQLAGFRRH